ncbi:class I SAM-dependent methyltransferase [Fibrella aquatilis]|uniref:Class I SAM-dependent methyltransferase n=1 Tax=Fibrella aquatilis TaxID=2817059 RepID=A0A939G9B9_9BACT|nr:class I SAM-dependent methyltransferase [Fibrella aquatilis]MBO0932208.1 class I SAM-dependent methyltransferase [Fibrella aquatilis]
MTAHSFLLASLLLLSGCGRGQNTRQTDNTNTTGPDSATAYTTKSPAYDGTGRVYMGREIAQVMGHLGADWLERPERQQEERTDLLLTALALKPTDVVADIGAGTGFFSFPMARVVPQGKVLAVDIQPEMIEYLNANKAKNKAPNVTPILGTITDPKLPANTVDLALMIDAYHEFSNPREMGEALVRSLKPGGRIVLVEYRAEDPNVPIKEHHKMTEAQAVKEMKALGLKLLKNDPRLPQQHILIFGK